MICIGRSGLPVMCGADSGVNATRAGQCKSGVDYCFGIFGLLGNLQAFSLDMRL